MSEMIELLKPILADDNEIDLNNFLTFCDESKLLIQHNVTWTDIETMIKTLLNSDNNQRGIQILDKIVNQCPEHVLIENILFWGEQCVVGINTPSGSDLSCSVLCKLLNFSINYAQVKGKMSVVIRKVLDCFVKKQKYNNMKELKLEELKCLEVILKHYIKCCKEFKPAITKLIFSYLESSSLEAYHAGNCFLYLSLTATKANVKEASMTQQNQLISLIHTRFDLLFTNIIEIGGPYYKRQEDLNFYAVYESNPLLRMQRIKKQIQNLVNFFCTLLLHNFPIRKNIKTSLIMSIIYRGLSVNFQSLSSTITTDSVYLQMQLPEIHVACLKLLDALINCVRFRMIAHGHTITKFLMQELNWTKSTNCAYGEERPFRSVRVMTYKCLYTWLTLTKSCSNILLHSDDLINNFISDIQFVKHKNQIDVSVLEKRQKLRKLEVPLSVKKNNFIVFNEANKDVCYEALRVIPPFLEATSTLLTPQQHKLMQEIIIEELLCFNKEDMHKVFCPYTDDNCRFGLYQSLLALCLNYHSKFPIPLSYGNKIFSEGLKDPSLEIINLCTMSLSCLANISFPVVPGEQILLENDAIDKMSAYESRLVKGPSSKMEEDTTEIKLTNGSVSKTITTESNSPMEVEDTESHNHTNKPTIEEEESQSESDTEEEDTTEGVNLGISGPSKMVEIENDSESISSDDETAPEKSNYVFENVDDEDDE